MQEPTPPTPVFAYRGIDIPEPLLARTGSGSADFEVIAALHERMLADYAPVESHHHVLDMGCGIGRDALLLADRIGEKGRYTGFDVDRESVHWCARELTPRWPTFHFFHLDVRSTVYNPEGALRGVDVRFPVEAESVDRAIAHSLFTHLLEEDALHYLGELRRALRPDGRALLTFFVATDAEMPASLEGPVAAFRFPHRLGEGLWVNSLERPEDSVAVTPATLRRWLDASRLRLARPVVAGYWLPGRSNPSDYGQDLAVVERI
jgi:SAM-dependent methyltransferase